MLCAVLALAVAGCDRGDRGPVADPGTLQGPPAGEVEPATDTGAADVPPTLEDVIEHDPRYVVGISFPPEARNYPGLAAELDAYARAARADLEQAVASLGQGRPTAPYDLALNFDLLVETPQVVAVAADGSTYTGGAHGNPLVARFVWLPAQRRMLTAEGLVPDGDGWRAISGYVREQLHLELFERADAADMEPEERTRFVRSAGEMIDEGSTPDPANFAHFEPVMGPDGRIEALRFVFPPYQVGPYSDGTRTVVVPAAVLLPHVADEYRGLFATG